MNKIDIGGHTIDVDRLTPNGFVLDAGCRDFTFSRELERRGCRVVSLDADPTVARHPEFQGAFANVAISDQPGECGFLMTENLEARHLTNQATANYPIVKVPMVTITELMESFYGGILHWDVVKLDVEGAEYRILQSWPGPISTQLSIEFHEHCKVQPPEVYDAIFRHLGQWYDVAQHVKEARYCCPPNWFDTLLVLKEGI